MTVAEATRLHDPDVIRFTHTVAVSRGEIIPGPGGMALIAADDFDANQEGSYYRSGVWRVKSASGTTFSVGDLVQWDASADLAIAVGAVSGDFTIGRAVYAKTSGTEYVDVLLNDHDDYALVP